MNEENQENTDTLALEFFKQKLNIDLNLDQVHRIGKYDKSSNWPRPVTVKFIRCNDRKKFFSKENNLKALEYQ